jgi:hypothetical protein
MDQIVIIIYMIKYSKYAAADGDCYYHRHYHHHYHYHHRASQSSITTERGLISDQRMDFRSLPQKAQAKAKSVPKIWSGPSFYLPSNLSTRWPRDLRRRSAAACLLRLWVRIWPGAWMSVSCGCCVWSRSGLCDELITRPEESYRLWCVVMGDLLIS